MTEPDLIAGRAWFAVRPHFETRWQREDFWRCGGFFIEWHKQRRRWCAWKHKGDARFSRTPADALAAIGYVDPEVTP